MNFTGRNEWKMKRAESRPRCRATRFATIKRVCAAAKWPLPKTPFTREKESVCIATAICRRTNWKFFFSRYANIMGYLVRRAIIHFLDARYVVQICTNIYCRSERASMKVASRKLMKKTNPKRKHLPINWRKMYPSKIDTSNATAAHTRHVETYSSTPLKPLALEYHSPPKTLFREGNAFMSPRDRRRFFCGRTRNSCEPIDRRHHFCMERTFRTDGALECESKQQLIDEKKFAAQQSYGLLFFLSLFHSLALHVCTSMRRHSSSNKTNGRTETMWNIKQQGGNTKVWERRHSHREREPERGREGTREREREREIKEKYFSKNTTTIASECKNATNMNIKTKEKHNNRVKQFQLFFVSMKKKLFLFRIREFISRSALHSTFSFKSYESSPPLLSVFFIRFRSRFCFV